MWQCSITYIREQFDVSGFSVEVGTIRRRIDDVSSHVRAWTMPVDRMHPWQPGMKYHCYGHVGHQHKTQRLKRQLNWSLFGLCRSAHVASKASLTNCANWWDKSRSCYYKEENDIWERIKVWCGSINFRWWTYYLHCGFKRTRFLSNVLNRWVIHSTTYPQQVARICKHLLISQSKLSKTLYPGRWHSMEKRNSWYEVFHIPWRRGTTARSEGKKITVNWNIKALNPLVDWD